MLSVLRIVSALIFFAHGTQKILGFPASDFSPAALSLMWAAGVLGLIGGAMLIVGLFTRPHRLRALRPDGGGLLDRARAAELLSHPEQRRCGDQEAV
jgi:hypothetical protein